MSARRVVARSLSWASAETWGVSALSAVTLLLLARLIGPAEFGLAALALGIVHFLHLFVEVVFHDAIVQRETLDESHVDTAWCASAAAGIGLAGACVLWSPAAAALFGAPELDAVLDWMALSLIFGGVSGVLVARLRREMEFRAVALRSLVGRTAGAAVGIALALAGFGVWSLVAQHVIAAAAAALCVWIAVPRRPRLRFAPARFRELLRFALPAFGSHLVWNATQRALPLLVGYLLGTTPLGYFNVAHRMVDTVRAGFGSAVSHVSLVLFSRRQRDRAALGRLYREATGLTCAAVLPVFAGLAVCAAPLVAVLLGPGWEPAAPVVQVLAAGAMLGFVRFFPSVALRAVGRPELTLIVAVVGFAASIGALLVFGRSGLLAAALAWVAFEPAKLPLSLWLVRRALGIGWVAQLRPAAAPLGAALGMGAAVAALQGPLADWPAWVRLAASVPTGAALYALALWGLGPQWLSRARRLAAEGLRGGAPLPTAPPVGAP